MAKKKIDYASMFTLRKDGRYMARWTDETGRHCLYDRDPEKLYERYEAAINAEPEPVTFREMAERWECSHVEALSRGTQATYKAPLADLVAEFGDRPLAEIVPADINRLMLEEKQKGYSYKHAATKKSILKQIFDAAIIDKDIPILINPVSSVKVQRGMKKGAVEPPDADQIEAVKANLDKPFGDFVAMLLYTGMRTEEAVALRWGDIGKDFITVIRAADLHGAPLIKETKTEAGERQIPILDKHRPFLTRPAGAGDDDLIFSDDGRLLTRSKVTKRWIAWCRQAGLAEQKTYENRHRGKKVCTRTEWRPLVTPHQLRHLYATVLYEQEVDELTARDIMGHKDIETTRKIYTALRQKHKAEEVKKINAGF